MRALVKRERERGLIDETWMSKPPATPKSPPPDGEPFGDLIEKLG